MTLGQHQEAFTRDLVKLIVHAQGLGYETRIGEVQRPVEMQQIYIKTGRSKTMNSYHLKRLAIDLNIIVGGKMAQPGDYRVLGDYWESLDPLNKWGGRFVGFVAAQG